MAFRIEKNKSARRDWVFESNNEGFLHLATGDTEIIKRRQDLPPAYFRDGSIYITKTTVIKNGSFFFNLIH